MEDKEEIRKQEIEKYKKAIDRFEKSIRKENKGWLFDSEIHMILTNINMEIYQLSEKNEDSEYNRHIRNIKHYTSELMGLINNKREDPYPLL